MTETDFLNEHILRRVPMSPEELSAFTSGFKLKTIKKKQYIIQPDFTARYRTFVVRGAFRSYVIGEDGTDHTIQFAVDDWWISDMNSYIYQRPATMFVVALEDSLVFQIDFETEQQLKACCHKYESFFRIAAERTAAYHQRRIISALTLSAEDRYLAFLETYPEIASRLPQYAVASYLGMTTQFLSQIRNKRVKKDKSHRSESFLAD